MNVVQVYLTPEQIDTIINALEDRALLLERQGESLSNSHAVQNNILLQTVSWIRNLSHELLLQKIQATHEIGDVS